MNTYASETLKTRSCYYYLKKTKQLDVYRDYLKGTITKEELYDYVPEEVIHTVINSEISDKTYKNIFHEIDAIMEENGVTHVDVIIGGPPCQAYSLVGRASDPNGMENDPRNDLYIQYARFLNKYKPKMFVFENVPGMLTAKKGVIWKRIQQRLRTVGYDIEYREVYANDFGVLQRRKRIIIIGWRKDLDLYYPEFRHVEYNASLTILSKICKTLHADFGDIVEYVPDAEIWDLYNENRELLGKDHVRGEQLPIDGYHLVVHVWIRNSKGEYLISQRSANRPTYPLMWECVGGSVVKGEDSLLGAIREAKEEVGVDLMPENGQVLFTKTRKIIDGKIYNDIMDVWLFEYEGEVDLGNATTDEVAQVAWMNREQIKELFDANMFVNTLEYFFTEVDK